MHRKVGQLLISAVAGVLIAGGAQALPVNQITAHINDNLRTTLFGNTRPEATALNDRGRVSDAMPIDHMQLVLHRSDAQEKALNQYIHDLTDKKSPNYHKWLTAAQFGQRFGVSNADISKITSWMTSHGLHVNFVSPAHTYIDFSGTAGAVRGTFHTEIHNLNVAGAHHIANMSDPQIPVALASAVTGIVSLNDFRPHANFVQKTRPVPKSVNGKFTEANGVLAVGAKDLQTIYNLTGAYNAGFTGAGQTVVVIEDSDVVPADFDTFRKTMGLSKFKQGKFALVHPNCPDPGIIGSEGEATLDMEWASAAAPDATIEMASCTDTVTFGGLIALQNLLASANPPPIVSMSFGECEAESGRAQNAAFNATFQQAAAEGVSVFVSAGDESATSCDHDRFQATHGIGVSGWASSPFDVAVGGTDFGDTFAQQNAKYWRATNKAGFESAKSYIPEIPWNDSCASGLIATFVTGSPVAFGATGFCNTPIGRRFQSTASGSGGPSSCATGTPARFGVVSGSCKGWAKPDYQVVFGNPADGVRDLPDVSLFAANGVWSHFYIFCDSTEGRCTPGHPETWGGAGGTSFSAPIMAGIMALIDQKAGRQGNPNPTFYALGAQEYGTKGNAKCNSTRGKKVASTCIFYDVTQGDFDVNCTGLNNCFHPSGRIGVVSVSDTDFEPAYPAAPGWDFTTGLGTVNVGNLVNAWPQ